VPDKSFEIELKTTATGDGAQQLRAEIAAVEAEIKKLNETAGPGGGSEAFQVRNLQPRIDKLEEMRAKLAEIEAQAGKTGDAAEEMGTKVAQAAEKGTQGFNWQSFAMGALMSHWRRGIHLAWQLGESIGKAIFRPVDWAAAQKDADKMATEFAKIREEINKVKLDIDRAFEATRKTKDETQAWLDKIHSANKALDERDARNKKVADSQYDRKKAEIEASDLLPVEKEKRLQDNEQRRRADDFAKERATMERELNAAIIDREESKRMLAERQNEGGAGAKQMMSDQLEIERARDNEKTARAAAADKFADLLKFEGSDDPEVLFYKEQAKKEYDDLHQKVKEHAAEVEALIKAHPALAQTNTIADKDARMKDAAKLAEQAKSEEIKQIETLKNEVEKSRALALKLRADIEAADKIHANKEAEAEAHGKTAMQAAQKKESDQANKGEKANEKPVADALKEKGHELTQEISAEKKAANDVARELGELAAGLKKTKAPGTENTANRLHIAAEQLKANPENEKLLNQIQAFLATQRYSAGQNGEGAVMNNIVNLMRGNINVAKDHLAKTKTLSADVAALKNELAGLKSQVDGIITN
jgi:hypothetical protein